MRKRVAGSLAWKLGAGFGCVVVMIVLIVAVSWWSIARMTDTSAAIDQSLTPRLIAADDARTAAAAMRSSQTAYVLVGPDGRAEYVADRGVLDQAMLNLQLRERTPGDRKAYDAVEAALRRTDQVDTRLWADVSAGRTARAEKLLRSQSEQANDELIQQLNLYQRSLQTEEKHLAEQARSTAWTSAALVLGLGVCAIVLAALAAVLLSRQIVRSARELLEAANGLADGDVDQHVDMVGSRRARPHGRRLPPHDRGPAGRRPRRGASGRRRPDAGRHAGVRARRDRAGLRPDDHEPARDRARGARLGGGRRRRITADGGQLAGCRPRRQRRFRPRSSRSPPAPTSRCTS